ncbi:translation elongation factor Ts [Candidatus Peregrinibacteria bacterium]|nr:translation elongation factor Ts [Candidatus Peregrinibacteria bacterium]
MSVSIEQIKKLRDATGVSMTACKNALEETDGDFDKAVEELRKKGEAKAAARADRVTSNGTIVIKTDGKKASIVKLLCETDFVSKGDDFCTLTEVIADKILAGEILPDDKEIQDVKDAVLKMGENILIGDMELLEGEVIGTYVHSNKKIGAVVVLKGGSEDLAKDIAMHVAATNPSVISPEEVSEDLVNKEKVIWKEQLEKEGKPAEILDNILKGKEKKFREENALLKQQFVKDPNKSIEDLLKENSAELEGFVRFEV